MKVAVFCSSSNKVDDKYKKDAYKIGKQLALAGHSLVFGGGQHGLMGQVAKGVKDNGGYVLGVNINLFNDPEINFPRCDKLTIVETINERKDIMINEADAFLILEGGFGTYDEMCDVLERKDLSFICKPIIIYNGNHYYDDLISFIEKCYQKNFCMQPLESICKIACNIKDITKLLEE